MNQETKSKGSTIGAIILVIIILVIAVGFVYWLVQSETDSAQKMLDKGCIPLTANQYGFPTTYSCPR